MGPRPVFTRSCRLPRVNYDGHAVRIDAVLKKRTLESKARKAEAEARITEAEAGLKEVALMQARIALVERLREQGLVPISDEKGSMRIVKAPSNFNWEALTSGLGLLRDPESSEKSKEAQRDLKTEKRCPELSQRRSARSRTPTLQQMKSYKLGG